MPDYSLDVDVTVSPFPEGEEMNPSQFAQWLADNLTINISGSFLAGQIDGAAPTTDIGLLVKTAERKLMIWNGTAYQNLLNVPVGSIFPWAGYNDTTAPEDYLLVQGQLLLKTDFPLLWTTLGDLWKADGDDAAYFRLPDVRGRVPMGNGTGVYNPHNKTNPQNYPTGEILHGNLSPRGIGQYFGYEWPALGVTTPTGAPAALGSFVGRVCRHITGAAAHVDWVNDSTHFEGIVQPSFVIQWIIKAK